MLSSLVFVVASLALARAQVTPTEPSPGKDFPIGGECSFGWTPDTSGTWGTTYVELMTGSNDVMVHLTTVYQFDGTDPAQTTYTFPCPNVTPHAAIYFYQFTSTGSLSPQWTGRFSISANHDLVPPENTDEKGTPWGTGALVDPSTAVAAPPTSPEAGGAVPPPADTTSSTSSSTTPAATAPPPATTTNTNPGQGHPIAPAGSDVDTYVPPSASSPDSSPTQAADGGAGARLSISALAVVGALALVAL